MAGEFQVKGTNAAAPFTLKIHRGDGMVLLAMNWKDGLEPPTDFVGFSIEYRPPNRDQFYVVGNRLAFAGPSGEIDPARRPTLFSPIQLFHWVHFPPNAELEGEFEYRVKPVFMSPDDELSYGEPQIAKLELRRETYPGVLNVCFTRGFISSQAFVDRYERFGPIATLLPPKADAGLDFAPTHPKAQEALTWMGFEARHAILETLDQAIADNAQVRVVAYDLSEPDVVSRLEQVGPRLQIIIDSSAGHGKSHSAESLAAARLAVTAGATNVKRQKMGNLQHNKTIAVDGPNVQKVVCGSTNFTWRGFFVQNNNAIILQGKSAVQPFLTAFEDYWNVTKDGSTSVAEFGATGSAKWTDLGMPGINAKVAFSPHSTTNAFLESIAKDITKPGTQSVLYSLAFLHQTEGPMREAIKTVTERDDVFVYGLSDQAITGLVLQKTDGNEYPVFPTALDKKVPKPFKPESTGGFGVRLHHKFVVIDFDKPSARVYLGSYNFSDPADTKNGENLLLIRDRRVAVSYMVEALRLFDHYNFRVKQAQAEQAHEALTLSRPPRVAGEKAWWAPYWENSHKVRERLVFA